VRTLDNQPRPAIEYHYDAWYKSLTELKLAQARQREEIEQAVKKFLVQSDDDDDDGKSPDDLGFVGE